jgi:hypothetical protein
MRFSRYLLGGLLAVAPLYAGVLYDNGPVNGNYTGIGIYPGQDIEDSFTLSAGSTVTGFTFADWHNPGDFITAVNWTISDTPDQTNVYGSGADAPVSNSLLCTASGTCGQGTYDVAENEVDGLNVSLAAGTYYLTLTDGVNSLGAYWDMNNGPSTAYAFDGTTPLLNYFETGSNSETFQILGGSSTPEPGTVLLAACGLLGVAGALRRRKVA